MLHPLTGTPLDIVFSIVSNLNNTSYSAAGLSDYGFTSGSNGKARQVNQWLKNVDGLLEKDGKLLKATPQFRNWLINEAWRDSEDLPVL